MPEVTHPRADQLKFRAAIPRLVRYAALAGLAVTLLVVVVAFYRERTRSAFKLKSEHTQLSTELVAEVAGYERLESENGVSKYYVKADLARTFSDQHQEFENVYIEVFDAADGASDKMKADSGLYVPEPDKNFTAYLKGNVNIETGDALKVRTSSVVYTRRDETGQADDIVEFERGQTRGRSIGALLKMAERRIELLRDVDIETFDSADLLSAGLRYARLKAGTATLDQSAERIDLGQTIAIDLNGVEGQSTAITAVRASVFFKTPPGGAEQLETIELSENVHIVGVKPGQQPTTVDAGFASYERADDRFELRNGLAIVTDGSGTRTEIKGHEGVFERPAGKVAVIGAAQVAQGADLLRADQLNAELYPDGKAKSAVGRGSASLRQTGPERTTVVSAPELNAFFLPSGEIRNANAIGESTGELVPQDQSSYSTVMIRAARGIGIGFKGAGLVDAMRTDGRTTIQLNVLNTSPDSANKRVTADVVKTIFAANGRDIAHAEAVGNAEMYVEPLNAGPKNYKTTINAPRFDCEFFPTGNNARVCVAARKGKTTRVPTVPAERRGTQTVTADVFTVNFHQQTSDVEMFRAEGGAKFSERDRSAIAQQMAFTPADGIVRLRGGEPTAWDSRGRTRAREIDLDTQNDRSYLRGSVSTTYYSRKQVSDAVPFGSSERPVFITADTAEFDHGAESAVFSRNARGWQDNNYVRAERILLDQKAGRMLAEGSVQSLLYNARLKQKARESTVPVYASAGSLAFDRSSRLLQYRQAVDIRQGTDRITSGSADVFLDEKNEVTRTVVEQNVVITQPGRRGTGEWAQYVAADETATIRGNPAIVTDAENGSSQGGELTFFMRENRVVSESRTKQNPAGRSRSVYKVKPNQ